MEVQQLSCMTPRNFVVSKAMENNENFDDSNCKCNFAVGKAELP